MLVRSAGNVRVKTGLPIRIRKPDGGGGMFHGALGLGPHGRALIQAFEGFHEAIEGGAKARSYKCPAGVWTIGWGHTKGVKKGQVATRAECQAMFDEDVSGFVEGVRALVTVPLNQNQFDALVSFAFNVGLGNLKNSNLLRVLNAGDYDGVPAQLMRWVKAGGQTLPGLVRRRQAESALFAAPANAKIVVLPSGDVLVEEPADDLANTGSGGGQIEPTDRPVSAPPGQSSPSMPQKVSVNPAKPLSESGTVWGGITAALASAAEFARQKVEQVKSFFAQMEEQMGFDPIWILIALVAVGFLLILHAKIREQWR